MHACGVYVYVCVCACLHCRYTERWTNRPSSTLEYHRVPSSTLEYHRVPSSMLTYETPVAAQPSKLADSARLDAPRNGKRENDSCCKMGSEQVVNCGVRKLVELNPEYAVQVNDDADVEVRLHFCRYCRYCQYCQCLLVRPLTPSVHPQRHALR